MTVQMTAAAMGPLVSVNLVTTLNIGRKAVVRRLTALVAEVVITSLVSGPVLLSNCPTRFGMRLLWLVS